MSTTIVETKLALLEYFSQEDVIRPDKEHDLVKLDCEDEQVKIGLIKSALEELTTSDVVRKLPVKDLDAWALVKPISMIEYTLPCRFDTILGIAETVNRFLKGKVAESHLIDPTILSEKDLKKLLVIANTLLDKSS